MAAAVGRGAAPSKARRRGEVRRWARRSGGTHADVGVGREMENETRSIFFAYQGGGNIYQDSYPSNIASLLDPDFGEISLLLANSLGIQNLLKLL